MNMINEIDPLLFTMKSLKILHLYLNSFIEIPTNIYQLVNLEEIKFEWFRFLNPPLSPFLNRKTDK